MSIDIYNTLSDLSIAYERIDHPAVYTSEEARRLVPHHPAKTAKNLFLRDKKGKRHILLVVEDHKTVQFKSIEQETGLSHLSMGSPERLMRYLGVKPGAVSPLALANDPQGQVELLVDRELWKGQAIQVHPLVNTATLILSIADMERFINYTNHRVQFVDVS